MITQMDFQILDWLRSHLQCGILDGVMKAASFLGEGGWLFLLVALVMLARKKHRRTGAAVLAALALSLLICNGALKPLIGRPRPFHLRPEILLIVSKPGEWSFPSGHTSAAFAFAGALFAMGSRMKWAAAVLAAVIGFSRLYLYVHFPTDVLGGILTGLFCGWLGAFLVKKSGIFSNSCEK